MQMGKDRQALYLYLIGNIEKEKEVGHEGNHFYGRVRERYRGKVCSFGLA